MSKRRKIKRVHIAIGDVQLTAWKAAAKASNMSLSEWIRHVCGGQEVVVVVQAESPAQGMMMEAA